MKSLLLIAFMLLSNCVFAADADAQLVLKSKLANLQSYSAAFSQTVTDVEGEVLQQATGQLTLQQPSKLFWQVDEPNENTLIADGETLWHIDPFVEQVVAMRQSDAVQNNPIVLLTDPGNDLWQQFEVAQLADSFVISARADGGQIEKLVLEFEQDSLIGLKMVDSQKQLSEFSFSEIQQNIQLEASLFKFALPPGFELDDQRPQ